MGVWIDVVRVCAALNVVLLAGLSLIWARNYRQFGSKHALGLLIFGLMLLAENAVALHVFTFDPTLSAWFGNPDHMPNTPGNAMMALRVLETAGLVFLAWVTMD